MENKLYIGLVGEIGSGKGKFIEIVKNNLPNKKIKFIKFSEVLADVLEALAMEKTRDNLQRVAIAIDEMFGDGTFNNAVKQRAINMDSDITIFDGMRWPADEQMIRELKGIVIYITANQKIRYQRTINRGEKIGENETSFETFQKQELMKNETFIKDISSRADYKILNEGSLEEFENEVKKILTIIKKMQ